MAAPGTENNQIRLILPARSPIGQQNGQVCRSDFAILIQIRWSVREARTHWTPEGQQSRQVRRTHHKVSVKITQTLPITEENIAQPAVIARSRKGVRNAL